MTKVIYEYKRGNLFWIVYSTGDEMEEFFGPNERSFKTKKDRDNFKAMLLKEAQND
jgi:hypothetical protein